MKATRSMKKMRITMAMQTTKKWMNRLIMKKMKMKNSKPISTRRQSPNQPTQRQRTQRRKKTMKAREGYDLTLIPAL